MYSYVRLASIDVHYVLWTSIMYSYVRLGIDGCTLDSDNIINPS